MHTYTITDNDAASVEFNATSSNGAESVSSAVLQVDLSAQSSSAVTVAYAVTGTATGSGTDFTLADGTLTIPANTSSADITIASIVDDSLVEGSETVIVTLSSPSGASLGTNTVHTYTITDNDRAQTPSGAQTTSVQFDYPTSSSQEGETTQQVGLRLSITSVTETVVNYSVTGTAQGGGVDHDLMSGSITMPAGSISAFIPITGIVDDGIVEDDETIIITIDTVSNAIIGAQSSHIHTVEGDLRAVTAVIEEAENALQNVADQLAQERGSNMIGATHKLIKTSLDNLVSNIQIGTESFGQENTAGGPSSSNTEKSFNLNKSDPYLRMRRDLVDSISLLNAEADEHGYSLNFGYDLNMPLINDKQSVISKVALRTSKQKDGPKTFRLIGSVALETRSTEEESAVGKFLHFSREVADFETSYKGKKKTRSIALGIYDVYRPSDELMTSLYLTAGISDNDVKLKKGAVDLNQKYLSYQAQFGISAGRMIKQRGRLSNTKFSIDVYADYAPGHNMSFTSGLSKFNRLTDGKLSYELQMVFEPQTTFIFDADDKTAPYLFVVSPVVKCGVGSMKSSCGGGTAFNLSRQLANNRGNWAFGYSFDIFRGITSHELMMNLKRNAYQNDNIQTTIEFGANESINSSEITPVDYFAKSKLVVHF